MNKERLLRLFVGYGRIEAKGGRLLKREQIVKILARARQIDPECQMFGASAHRYQLNPPIEAELVRGAEEKYGFSLPEEYFWFLTEIADGGAGPDYGIGSFRDFLKVAPDPWARRFQEAYRHSLARPFAPWPMQPEEVGQYAICTKEAYDRHPDQYFLFPKEDEEDLCDTDGFYILGTHGCQWDFGLITAGVRRGQVFDTDNEGAYRFLAGSFDEFYQTWLDSLTDEEGFRRRLKIWTDLADSRKAK